MGADKDPTVLRVVKLPCVPLRMTTASGTPVSLAPSTRAAPGWMLQNASELRCRCTERRPALVTCIAEGQNGKEDEAQEGQPDAKPRALAEILGDREGNEDQDDEIHEGDEHEDDPPTRLP